MGETILSTRAPARPEEIGRLRRMVERAAQDAGADATVLEALRLASSEALTNVVMHAYVDGTDGEIIVELQRAGDGDRRLRLVIADEGVGLVPRLASPGLGLGIALMKEMAEEFTIRNRSDGPGAEVTLGFALRQPCLMP